MNNAISGKEKAGHLVRFIEHEPFELRLLGMPFSPPEQEILYSIIRDFLNAHCTAAECRRASLHLPFRLLLKSSGFSDFGRRLRRAGKNTGIRRKLLHFCPVPSWREEWQGTAAASTRTAGGNTQEYHVLTPSPA